jgi:hypothetical protein
VPGLHDAKELLDGLADVTKKLPLGGLRTTRPEPPAKVGPDKCIEVTLQLLDVGGTTLARKLAEPHEERHATDYAA